MEHVITSACPAVAAYLLQRSGRQPMSSNIDDVIRTCHHRQIAVLGEEASVHGVVIALQVNIITTTANISSTTMKKRSERRKHCVLAVVRRNQKFSPRRRPLREGAGRPKFNQLEMDLHLQTQFGEDRCMQFRVIVVTDSQTNPQINTPTHT